MKPTRKPNYTRPLEFTQYGDPRMVVSVNTDENHDAAARHLIEFLGWRTNRFADWYRGGYDSGNVYVCAGEMDKLPLTKVEEGAA